MLHSIWTHFNDCVNCDAHLENAKICAITIAKIRKMKEDYLESEETLTSITGLSVVYGRVIGENNIPLSYITRPLNVGDFEADYDTRLNRLNVCTILNGHKFKSDNGTVFSLLIQHTGGTEGYSLVQQYESKRNGRAAWTSLLHHYEGSTFCERVTQ